MSLEPAGTVAGLRTYTEATKLAMSKGQVVGEKSEYYVTLRQLEDICKESLEIGQKEQDNAARQWQEFADRTLDDVKYLREQLASSQASRERVAREIARTQQLMAEQIEEMEGVKIIYRGLSELEILAILNRRLEGEK
jgi:hypothetical protein